MPRDRHIDIRCTPEESTRWHALARRLGFDSLASLIRFLLAKAEREE